MGAASQRGLWRRATGGGRLILLFGGQGQVGQEIVRVCVARHVRLAAPGRGYADITDRAAIRDAIASCRPSPVINAAGYTKVDPAESEVEAALRGNELGPATIAQACADAGAPLVHISTDYVFDGTKPGAYVEEDRIAPINNYGRSKAAGERAVQAASSHHVIIGTSCVYGEFGQNFLRTYSVRRRPGTSCASLQTGGCPTSAHDLAAAIVTIALRLMAREDVFRLGASITSPVPA